MTESENPSIPETWKLEDELFDYDFEKGPLLSTFNSVEEFVDKKNRVIRIDNLIKKNEEESQKYFETVKYGEKSKISPEKQKEINERLQAYRINDMILKNALNKVIESAAEEFLKFYKL